MPVAFVVSAVGAQLAKRDARFVGELRPHFFSWSLCEPLDFEFTLVGLEGCGT